MFSFCSLLFASTTIKANVYYVSCVALGAQQEVEFEADRPYLKVAFAETAELECCYASVESRKVTWHKCEQTNRTLEVVVINSSATVKTMEKTKGGTKCGTLLFHSAQRSDTGLYRCWMYDGKVRKFSHGTYLHVRKCSGCWPGHARQGADATGRYGDTVTLSTANTL